MSEYVITENRVSRAIEAARVKVSALDDGGAALDEAMAVGFEEHFQYQTEQARAHADGLLTTDEARILYVALGEVGSPENGGWAAGTDTATKVVVTRLMLEILERKVH